MWNGTKPIVSFHGTVPLSSMVPFAAMMVPLARVVFCRLLGPVVLRVSVRVRSDVEVLVSDPEVIGMSEVMVVVITLVPFALLVELAVDVGVADCAKAVPRKQAAARYLHIGHLIFW